MSQEETFVLTMVALPFAILLSVAALMYRNRPVIWEGWSTTSPKLKRFKRECARVQALWDDWRARWPEDARVDAECSLFILSDGSRVDIARHMTSFGYPPPVERHPICPEF